MKTGFYPKLAFDGIRKNRRMYVPFICTCIGMVMMFYIISYLHYSDSVAAMRGGAIVQTMLNLGTITVGIFSCIFLFYTNSFLIRRRKKEFGLYHILGMGKRNIARILFWETMLTALISLVIGIGFGILFSKLAELGMLRLMHAQATLFNADLTRFDFIYDYRIWLHFYSVVFQRIKTDSFFRCNFTDSK